MLSSWILAGFLCGGMGQHLLYQPDVCPWQPLGRCASRDPGRHEPDPDPHVCLRETPEKGELATPVMVPAGGRQGPKNLMSEPSLFFCLR